MRILIALFVVLLSFTSQASQRVILPGEVYAGAELICKVRNHTAEDLTITRYAYRILRINNFGQREWIQLNYRCGVRCEINSHQQLFLTGPYNQRNFLQAQCWAMALPVDDGDDGDDNDDDNDDDDQGDDPIEEGFVL